MYQFIFYKNFFGFFLWNFLFNYFKIWSILFNKLYLFMTSCYMYITGILDLFLLITLRIENIYIEWNTMMHAGSNITTRFPYFMCLKWLKMGYVGQHRETAVISFRNIFYLMSSFCLQLLTKMQFNSDVFENHAKTVFCYRLCLLFYTNSPRFFTKSFHRIYIF